MTSDLLGRTLGDRYRFEHLIGEGTFAEVYRITDLRRRAPLAAKVLRSDIARDPALLQRFQREADVLARLQHPSIVRYYDIADEEGYKFILMDYIPGRTLDTILKEYAGSLRPYTSLTYLTPLASALHFAHSENVIHRDLKPANILLHENGTLYVTDFGIARLINVASELTMGTTVGTPLYMAPEQIKGDPITVATDIYALGVLLYRMYTGRVPFRGDSPGISGNSTSTRITYEHIHITPEPPIKINRRLDLAVQEIILRCLEKDPTQRFAAVSDLYDALAEAVGAPPIAIDAPALDSVTGDNDEAPPDMKLPEWSQFMPQRVASPEQDRDHEAEAGPVSGAGDMPHTSDDDTDDLPTLDPDSADDSDSAETLPPQSKQHNAHAAPTIEHPVPQPPTQPHLDDKLHEAARTIPHQARGAAPTIKNVDNVVPNAYPTPRNLARAPQAAAPPPPMRVAPPGYDYDDYDDYDRRPRNWTLIGATSGVIVVVLSLCIAVLYLSGTFNTDDDSDPAADLRLTNAATNTLPTGKTPPSTTITSANGARFAFDSRRAGTLDIYIMNTDGSGLTQLTGDSGAERGPAWSPDGTQIAYYGAVSETDDFDIFIINTDGTGLRNLTNSPGVDDRYPAWSPDGTQLAFHSNAGGDFDLYVINTDGTGLRAITTSDADDLGPDWSPDGTQIAYHTSEWDFPYEIAVMDLNTGGVRRLTNNENTNSFPTWSPDGTQLAYHAISSSDASINIYVMNASGTGVRQLTDTADRNAFPDWSPDSTQIIFQRGQPDFSAIYTMSASGSSVQALTDTRANFLPEWEPAP